MAGFLPFSAIYIELHYIFASIWGHKIYTMFGILFLAFILLVIVTSCICVALLYFQLCREVYNIYYTAKRIIPCIINYFLNLYPQILIQDHNWWWSVFLNGGATGLFIYAYAFFFYFHRSRMDGFLQSSFYFGYTGIVAYAFALMLGFIGRLFFIQMTIDTCIIYILAFSSDIH